MIKVFLQKKGIDILCYEFLKNQIELKDYFKGSVQQLVLLKC